MARRLPIGFWHAVPFWISLILIPCAWIGGIYGGWTVFLVPLASWWLTPALDLVLGNEERNADPDTADARLFWYRLLTIVWPGLQGLTIFGLIGLVAWTDHLSVTEEILLFLGVGIMSGAVGIVFAHELMHQKSAIERYLGDLLMAMALYGHFRSEHLLVHHRYVCTPRDTVTARYNEDFHSFFFRVVPESWRSAFAAEKAMLARKGLPWWDRSNPFWRYWSLKAGMVLLAVLIGGWYGLLLFVFQAVVAFWQLELINYIEHYGLVRKHLGNGKYEPTRPRHSWNAAQKGSNWFLINLQRHSDHHAHPSRRYPLLQNRGAEEAPQLPYGYAVMGVLALVPPLWRRVMNPRVRKWRAVFYPEITDWTEYSAHATPMPR